MPMFDGARVLVVEDNPVLAFDLADLIETNGAEPVGPAMDVATGMRLASEEKFDAALLDIDLGGERVWPVAEQLRARDIPYIFVSGECRQDQLPDLFSNDVCLEKPAAAEEIIAHLARMTAPD